MEGMLKKKVLPIAVIATGLVLTFAGTKALASEYNPSHQQEPVQAGQVMKDDTTYEYFELIGDTNSGFEYPESEMDWTKNDENVGSRGKINLNSGMYPGEGLYPFEGEYSAEMQIRGQNEGMKYGYFEIDLSSEDTIKLGEFDSLKAVLMRSQFRIPLTKWDFRIDLIGKKGEVMDTVTLAWGEEEEDTEHRFFKNLVNKDTLSHNIWRKRIFSEKLKELIEEHDLKEHKIKKLRFYLSANIIESSLNAIFVDNVRAHFTRQIITGAEETPTQRTPELTDIILNPSNLYQATFPERGTLTIYEASTGRRVQAPIEVYGHVDVDFSGFPAGVYFGVYKPQEGRHQVGKIIKTQ